MPTPRTTDETLARTAEAYELNGRNQSATALALGIARQTLQSRLAIIKAREENPDRAIAPLAEAEARDGTGHFMVKGVSTLLDANGNVTAQWVKTKVDEAERLAAIKNWIDERAERVQPLPPIPMLEKGVLYHDSAKRLNMITITDAHIGMLAWDKEAGDDWDLRIAKDTMLRTFVGLLRSMPPADTCIVNAQGDFFHFDGLKAITPAHGNILDADSRYQKMIGVGTDVLEQLVIEALTRHEHVHIKACEGNHDESSAHFLLVMLRRIFRDNPRVTVDDSPLPYYAYLHGTTMLGFHHGHLAKMEQLPGIFASEPRFRAMWGQSVRTYIHCGHHHCHEVIEKGGAEVERHPTLAARDAYAARGGYVADRRAFGITYHTELGEISRIAATPETYA